MQEKKGGLLARFNRFWKASPDGCHIWHGSRRARRYGAIKFQGTAWAAHRIAWVLAHGPIPDGVVIMHKCDNPLCVNPEHLSLGSQADNIADMMAKGRVAKGATASRTKLTDEQVFAIRAARARHADLAQYYGVGMTTISNIRNRVTWRHL